MSLLWWIVVYVLNTVFWVWVLALGGASRLENHPWLAWLLVHWRAAEWNDEQIRLFALLALIGGTGWFVIGLFVPAARFGG